MLFAGVGVARRSPRAGVQRLLPIRAVRQPPDGLSMLVRQRGRALEMVAVNPGTNTIAVLRHAMLKNIIRKSNNQIAFHYIRSGDSSQRYSSFSESQMPIISVNIRISCSSRSSLTRRSFWVSLTKP